MTLALDAPDGECRLVADAERLQQVVWNLLSNAVKFGRKGGSIRLRVAAVASSYALTVSDDGQGIAAEFLPYVFDRFQQADSSATRRVGGLGLGLALVRHLVGARRNVRVRPGRRPCTTFTIVLPVRAVAVRHRDAGGAAEAPAPSDAYPLSRRFLENVRVLVVDDEDDARELLGAVLVSTGAQVETARTAAEGLAMFERFRPHLLVSDIGMPDEDGYSFIQRVRARAPEQGGLVPALAVTAYARAQDRAAAIAPLRRHTRKARRARCAVAPLKDLMQRPAAPDEQLRRSPRPKRPTRRAAARAARLLQKRSPRERRTADPSRDRHHGHAEKRARPSSCARARGRSSRAS